MNSGGMGSGGRAAPGRALEVLFAATLLLSAFLLFSVEPLVGRMLLPVFGGSPGVWTTALVFFQGMLLVGYLVAHLSARRLALGGQIGLYAALLASAALVLPVALPEGTIAPAVSLPIPWLLGLLGLVVGAPFLVLAMTAPLLQRWFAHTGHAQAQDPYFLYAASNVGGFLALLAYPTVIEPWLGLGAQSGAWALLYGLLGLLGLAAALQARRGAALTPPSESAEARPRPSRGQRLQWLLLSFVPSSLLLGATLHVSTDIAAAPFLWIAPLALYLLSFVFVFARRPPLRHGWMIQAQAVALILLALFYDVRDLRVGLPLHLLALFTSAMVCHGELARRRPPAADLTEFYLWLSLGGFLGGLFNAILAPALFHSVLEYPLVLAGACLLRPGLRAGWPGDALLAAAFAAAFLPLRQIAESADGFGPSFGLALYGASALLLYLFRTRPLRFGAALAAVLYATALSSGGGHVLAQERSFFGVYRVESDASGRYRWLWHGSTIHGAQDLSPEARREPTTYYTRAGPLGQALEALGQSDRADRIAAIGLGVGTIACYRQAHQSLLFFEIDPLVLRLAETPRLFAYLAECPGAEIRIADGRVGLSGVPDGSFDVLVLDAFGSDAIPVHLLTREALALYFQKLSPDGVLLAHISNSYVDLGPVVASLAADAGLVAREQAWQPNDPEPDSLELATRWVVVARAPRALAVLDQRWTPLVAGPEGRLWTDDYSNLLGVLVWSRPDNTPPAAD